VLAVLITGLGFAQDCPKWGDKAGALHFLEENKLHSTDADPSCVDTAFATLSHDKDSTEALIGLLDFERSTKHDDFISYGSRYPATGALMTIGAPAVPHLIKAIKKADSQLVRINAAHALGAIHRVCADVAIDLLEKEAKKTETTGDEQTRLRAAQTYIRNFYHRRCKLGTS